MRGKTSVMATITPNSSGPPRAARLATNIYTNGKTSSPTAGGCLGTASLFPYSPDGNVQGTFDTCLVPGIVDTKTLGRQ